MSSWVSFTVIGAIFVVIVLWIKVNVFPPKAKEPTWPTREGLKKYAQLEKQRQMDLWLEKQQREELARRRIAEEQERQERKAELYRQAEKARKEGCVVCPRCLVRGYLTIDSEPCYRCGGCKGKGCNGDAGSQCQNCEDRDMEEQRRISDD